MKKLGLLAVLFMTLSVGGCKTAAYVNHPGSFNTFDSQTYDTLLVTHSVIESTKADLAANKFPANIAVTVKSSLNGLIDAYNAADAAYLVYHAGVAAGSATAAQQANVSATIANVNTATTNLTTAKGAQ